MPDMLRGKERRRTALAGPAELSWFFVFPIWLNEFEQTIQRTLTDILLHQLSVNEQQQRWQLINSVLLLDERIFLDIHLHDLDLSVQQLISLPKCRLHFHAWLAPRRPHVHQDWFVGIKHLTPKRPIC